MGSCDGTPTGARIAAGRRCLHAAHRVASGRRGVTSAEYAIIAVAIVVAVGSAVTLLSDPVNGMYVRVGQALEAVQAALISDNANGGR